eukprot:3937660-Prymnesium_polylepis.1
MLAQLFGLRTSTRAPLLLTQSRARRCRSHRQLSNGSTTQRALASGARGALPPAHGRDAGDFGPKRAR